MLGLEPINESDADTVFIDPNKLPLGMDVFTPDEVAAQDATKAFIKMGMGREDAETKAFEMFSENKCHARKD